MHSLMQKYIQMLSSQSGDNTAKVKAILEQCSNQWDWDGGDSMIADLLDDNNITDGDIVEFLKSVVEMGEGNRDFKFAVMAMETYLKREHHTHLQAANTSDYSHDLDDIVVEEA